MPKKRTGQLPSGNIRIRVYDYTDENGKQHLKSFTARTKAEAKAKAAEWRANKQRAAESITVLDAYKKYLEVNESRFGASTYRTYYGYIKKIEGTRFGSMKLKEISNNDFQKFINDLTEETSVKYVKNVASVLKRAIELELPDRRFLLSFKPRPKTEKHIPSDEDMLRVIQLCDDPVLAIAIQFAIQGFCRRGEVCAIQFSDIVGDQIFVHQAFALDVDNVYRLNNMTKTGESGSFTASASLLAQIKALGRSEGFVVNISPSKLTDRFRALVKASGVEPFSFHAIRHWANSHAVGMRIPPIYIEGMGRWSKGSAVRIKTYEHELEQEKKHYRDLYQSEMKVFCG